MTVCHLKKLKLSLVAPLLFSFRRSINMSVLPSAWKIAVIVPIHKKGDKSKVSNYRPISLTSIACKVMERVVADNIQQFLAANDIISNDQYAYTKGKSCQLQLLNFTNDIFKYLKNGSQVDVAYLDFSKAFDSVIHSKLLLKLKIVGIDGLILNWVEAFLTERSQCVRVGCYKSSLTPS